MQQSYKTDFLKQDTEISGYTPFPRYLLELPLSMTARVQYSLLLNRARLSQQNGWIDEAGHVFVYYTEAELGQALHKGRSAIQTAMRALEGQNLLTRKRIPGERGQRIYPRIIRLGKSTEQHGKGDLRMSESRQIDDWKTELGPPEKQSTNKQKDKLYLNNQKDLSENRTGYGRYQNVFLSDKQYQELKKEIPDNLERYIEEMSLYLEASGKRYQNYAAGLRMWAANDQRKKAVSQPKRDYSYDGEDSL